MCATKELHLLWSLVILVLVIQSSNCLTVVLFMVNHGSVLMIGWKTGPKFPRTEVDMLPLKEYHKILVVLFTILLTLIEFHVCFKAFCCISLQLFRGLVNCFSHCSVVAVNFYLYFKTIFQSSVSCGLSLSYIQTCYCYEILLICIKFNFILY